MTHVRLSAVYLDRMRTSGKIKSANCMSSLESDHTKVYDTLLEMQDLLDDCLDYFKVGSLNFKSMVTMTRGFLDRWNDHDVDFMTIRIEFVRFTFALAKYVDHVATVPCSPLIARYDTLDLEYIPDSGRSHFEIRLLSCESLRDIRALLSQNGGQVEYSDYLLLHDSLEANRAYIRNLALTLSNHLAQARRVEHMGQSFLSFLEKLSEHCTRDQKCSFIYYVNSFLDFVQGLDYLSAVNFIVKN